MHDYRDAEEVIRIGELMEQYPQEIERMVPCYGVSSGSSGHNRLGNGDLIRNDVLICIKVAEHTHFQGKEARCFKINQKTASKQF